MNDFPDLPPDPTPRPATGLVHDMPVDDWQEQCLELDPEVISEQMRKIPGQVAYWNSRFADAQREFNRATRRRHEYRARRRQQLRVELATGGKAPTAEALGDALELDEAYITHQEQCYELEAKMLKAQAWAKAMDTKRSMLMSLGGFVRDEMAAQPITA